MSATPRDENRVPGLVAKSDADNTVVVLEADPATKRLKVNTTITPNDVSPATQDITTRDIGSITTTAGANGQPSTIGTPTVGSVASFTLSGYDSARIQVTGIWTGTLVAQVSLDGVLWYNQGVHQTGTAYTTGSFTANFSGITNAAGVAFWRLQSTTTWTGTATVKVIASVNPSSLYIANNIKIADGILPTITDTIKAASTSPLTTDTSLVVALNPNTGLPAGVNIIGSLAANQSVNSTQINSSAIVTSATGVQKVGISDSLGNGINSSGQGFLKTTDEPRSLFYDPFDSSLDTTVRWTATIGNSAVIATNSAGSMSMGTGTTASGWSKLVSQPTFQPTVPAWIGYSFLNIFPDLASPIANSYRFWGAGTPATTPTTASPMTDALGFEISTSGKMYVVLYAGGVRTVIQDLSAATGNATQPVDAGGHRYIVQIRTDKVFFYIDTITSSGLVATGNFTYPSVQTLPMSMVAVGGSTPPVSNAQIQSVGATVWDTGKNSSQMSDGTYPWRKATVTAGGAQVINAGASTGTVTAVASSATVVTILAANPTRRGATISNASTAVMYLKLGSGASTSSYTVTISGSAAVPYSYYEVPFGYTGIITALSVSANGNYIATELT